MQPSTSTNAISPSFSAPSPVLRESDSSSQDSSQRRRKRGPIPKPFPELCKTSKYLRAAEIRAKYSQEEIINALTVESKKIIFLELLNVRNDSEESGDNALALFLNINGTKRTYQNLRNFIKNTADILPPYNIIKEAKNRCCPNFECKDQGAYIDQQVLIDKTVSRLFEQKTLSDSTYNMLWKIELDSTSGITIRHEKLNNDLYENSILTVAVVPLMLEDQDKEIIWSNPTMCSTRMCRPLEIEFSKETVDKIKEKYHSYESKIVTCTTIGSSEISHKFFWTMLDGKGINAICGNASTACNICGASYKELQTKKTFKVKEDNIKFGITILHVKINVLRNILELSYKLKFKEDLLSLKNIENKDEKKEQKMKIDEKIKINKKEILDQVNKEIGLQIDKVLLGKGTSNTGNVARKFFKNFEKMSKITGVDEGFLKNVYIAILCISSLNYTVRSAEFKKFGEELLNKYLSEYGEIQGISPTFHKLLIHTADAADFFKLPLGILSEENLEHGHQISKKSKSFFSRKVSRSTMAHDIMVRYLIETDPKISGLRGQTTKDNKELPPECLELLEGMLN